MTSSTAVLRVVDANLNRALEGLRVCEDIARFSLISASDTRRLRALRHAVAATARQLPLSPLELARARDSRRDPGRRAQAPSITSMERLLLINLQRAKEALRVLEEMSRIAAPRQTAAFQALRFRIYDVERSLLLHVAALRHPRPRRHRRSRPA